MNRLLVGALALALGPVSMTAQSLDDLNIQIHGYATQGFLYSNNNNILTTDSTDGSPAWTEAVINITSVPTPKLRIGVQGRYFLLGNFGNTITLDWAQADYKVNDKIGVRFGKIKTPGGLYNEIQDIDPSYLFALLPQAGYPIGTRNSVLSVYGGLAYGTVNGQQLGKFDYKFYGGERALAGNDGYFINLVEAGYTMPNGINTEVFGGSFHWRTPVSGLMFGTTLVRSLNGITPLVFTGTKGPLVGATGTATLQTYDQGVYFAEYDKNRLLVSAQASKFVTSIPFTLTAPSGLVVNSILAKYDNRSNFVMATFKVTDKFSLGVYDAQFINHKAALTPGRVYKDWTFSGRYDFNQYLYAKADEHFIVGTAQDYDTTMNALGLKPNSKLTLLKLGVQF